MKSMTQYLRLLRMKCVRDWADMPCIHVCMSFIYIVYLYLYLCASIIILIYTTHVTHTHAAYIDYLLCCCGWIACQTKIVVPDLSLLNRIYSYSHEFVSFERIKWMEMNKLRCAHDVSMRWLCKCVCVCVCMSANQTKLRIHWINYYQIVVSTHG